MKAIVLGPGERRVAWAVTPDGQPVVASTRALYLPGGTTLAWDEIERAHWEQPSLRLIELTEQEGRGARHEVELDLTHETDLPQAVRTHVSSSYVWSSHARLQPRGGVRIVGRRRSGREVLDWQLVFDRDTDPQDPALRAQAEEHLAAARRAIG